MGSLNIDVSSVLLGEACILNNILFTISSGEVVAVVGPNGAGKSTLLRIIAFPNQLRYDGSIVYDGRSLQTYDAALRSDLVSFVSSEELNRAHIRVEDFLSFAGASEDVVTSTMRICGITPLRSRYLSELSSGEFQLVVLAEACAKTSLIFMLDEPEQHLDVKGVKVVAELIQARQSKGITIFSTHSLGLALSHADYILGLTRDGTQGFFLPPEQVASSQLLDSLFEVTFSYHAENDGTYMVATR